MLNIMEEIMGAIAVSPTDEQRIKRLGKRLGVRSKAGVVRLAVDELERAVARREMTTAVKEYVRRHGGLDRAENFALGSGGVARDDA
jgi:hypothetical protein